jgi:hypothetical protein
VDGIRHAPGLANPEPDPTTIVAYNNHDSKVELAAALDDLRHARNIDDSLVKFLTLSAIGEVTPHSSSI